MEKYNLDNFKKYVGDDMFDEALKIMRVEMHRFTRDFADAYEENDFRGLQMLLHKHKTYLGYLDMKQTQELARKFEKLSEKEQLIDPFEAKKLCDDITALGKELVHVSG